MARSSSRSMWTAKLTGKPVARAGSEPTAARRRAFTGTVLGVDPSLRGTGLAALAFQAGQPRLLMAETVRLTAKPDLPACLGHIGRAVERLLGESGATCLAIEETIYVQNFQTAQIMGAARGAALTPAAMRGLPCYSYAPLRIKQAVVGYGRASKVQVGAMMRQILRLAEPLGADESDAAAVALCHAWTGKPH